MGLTKTQSGGLEDESVTLAKLLHGDGSSDGKFLRANNGADPTFETVSGTTINNNADNRVITGSGTANTLNGESLLTFDGTQLDVTSTVFGSGNVSKTQDGVIIQRNSVSGSAEIIAGRSGGNYSGLENYVAGASGVTKRHEIDYQSNFLWYGADGTTERMKLDSSGRLLIGTTTEGNNNGDELTIAKDSGNMGMTLRSGDSSNSHIYFSDATSGAGEYAGYIAYQHSDNSMHIGTNSGERVRIQSGGGISFNGDTAAANALDDYEEGTFTPAWNGGSGGVSSISYGTTNAGSYTKVGRMVTVTGRTDISSVSGGSGFWYLSNMPFNVNGGGKGFNAVGSVSLENTNFANDTTYVIATMEQNNNNMHLHTVRDNASLGTGVSPSNGAMTVQFTITYQTA